MSPELRQIWDAALNAPKTLLFPDVLEAFAKLVAEDCVKCVFAEASGAGDLEHDMSIADAARAICEKYGIKQ